MPGVTAVVCTRNRAASLRRTLHAVNAVDVTAADGEIVVVDNGSSDRTPAVIDAFAASASFPVTHIHEPREGTGFARNTGIRAARGKVILFFDDDCLPAADLFRATVASFEDGCYGWAGGLILLAQPDRDAAYGIDFREDRFDYPSDCVLDIGEVQGSCLAFTRDTLAAIGGFDTRFGPGTPYRCDDLEAVQRAIYAGYEGVHDPSLIVRHAHGRTWDDIPALDTANYRSRGAFHTRFLFAGHWRHLRYLVAVNPFSRRGRAQLSGAVGWVTQMARARH